jgi:hypothetical protein
VQSFDKKIKKRLFLKICFDVKREVNIEKFKKFLVCTNNNFFKRKEFGKKNEKN